MTLESRSRTWPLTLLVGLAAGGLVLAPWPDLVRRVLASEAGVVETATVLVALFGAACALRVALAWRRLPSPWLGLWFLVFGLGLLVVAGEEASWGQHWLRFATPEAWAERNLQQETNLHNSSLATERIPKTLLSLGVLATGVIWPWVHRQTGRATPPLGRAALLWPDPRLATAALIALGLRLSERVTVWLDLEDGAWRPWYVAHKGSIELFMLLFVAFHLGDALNRVRRRNVEAGNSQDAPDDRQPSLALRL